MKTVEVLYFDGCPNLEIAVDRARKAVAAVANPAQVQLVCIHGEAEAARRRFLGSPTILVDGADVDATAAERTDFAMQCRVYWVDGKAAGAPPASWIEAALRGHVIAGGAARSIPCCSASGERSRR